jgi:hypothetical protein
MRPPRAIALLALAAVSLVVALAGCGTSAEEAANLKRIRALVTSFAESHGPLACHLLTGAQVVKVYGGGGTPAPKVPVARAKCVKASASFRGEPIKITNAQIVNDTTAKVNAENQAATFTYTVTLRRGTKKKPWRIDDINQYKVKP